MTRDVVVVHPGVQHSGELAASLERAGRLAFLATRVQVGNNPPWIWRSKFVQQLVRRRIAGGLPDTRIRRLGASHELMQRSIGHRLPSGLAKVCDVRASARFIDNTMRLLGPEVKAVVGTDTASLDLFKRLERERPDIARILDVSHPLDIVVQPLIHQDAERWHLPLAAYDDYRGGPPTDQRAELYAADIILVASAFSASTLEFIGYPRDRVCRVPYAVDSPRAKAEVRNSSDRLSLLALGAMSERKGMSILLRAMSQLEANDVAVQLTIAGKTATGYQLPTTLPGNTRYVGAPDAVGVAALYEEADVLVLPSMCEGFGRTILEALAAGVSVITTERSGGPDILEHSPSAPVTIVSVERRDRLAEVIEDHASDREGYLRPADARASAELFSDARYLLRLDEALNAAIDIARHRDAYRAGT